jgi:hypothetical protein
MSNTAAIDNNNKGTLTAYNDTTGQIERVYCDPVNGALYIFNVAADANVPTTLNTAKIDENHKDTLLGYNETTGLPEALRCGANGELLAVVVS